MSWLRLADEFTFWLNPELTHLDRVADKDEVDQVWPVVSQMPAGTVMVRFTRKNDGTFSQLVYVAFEEAAA